MTDKCVYYYVVPVGNIPTLRVKSSTIDIMAQVKGEV